MTASQLRHKYLQFFTEHGHQVYPSGSLIPYDVTGRLDESLLFNGAGMVQFKPFFRGVAQPPHNRLATAQKCVRTGDIEDVGDLSHLTFFEMLGNFSFGDYFKREAILMSWEFLTDPKWLGLDPQRLSFTVFHEDDEAYEVWASCLTSVGIDPSTRVFRLGEETNYWPAGAFSSGPPGPCGPNSEMFYWASKDTPPPTGPYTVEDYKRDDEAGLWLEIWNDVFIQYEWQGEHKNPARPADGYRKTGMPELPFKSIDTGMGLERTAAVLSGFRSVYDTDLFQPILTHIGTLCGKKYGENEACDVAMRIIADHIRTACFCLADGIRPENTGRGYVLRRLIRRAVLKGQRVLGFERAFFAEVAPAVIQIMGDHYHELRERESLIRETLHSEEELFRNTLHKGVQRLQSSLAALGDEKILDGETAFQLYDTFGFPLEVTTELCNEAGVTVDVDGYDEALAQAQKRSRGGADMDAVYAGVTIEYDFGTPSTTPTEFVGYEEVGAGARIVGALPELDETGVCTGLVAVAIDKTPFYSESGGQVSDSGIIEGEGFRLKVIDLTKQDSVYIHLCEVEQYSNPTPLGGMAQATAIEVCHHQFFNKPVVATIDITRRFDIMRNHTATHLLHAALRNTLGTHVAQAGSLVNPDQLRFDFTHGKAVTPEQLKEIEHIVNTYILYNVPVVTYVDIPISEARARGAMALFGEKYGDKVRMVEISEFSRELCGGTHIGSTGEIGYFKIVSEASAAAGTRRIEARTGYGAHRWVAEQTQLLHEASALLKTHPRDLVPTIEKTLDQLKEERKRREQLAQQTARSGASVDTTTIGAIELAIQELPSGDPKDAERVADVLTENQPNRVGLVILRGENKVTFVCKVGKAAMAAGAHAGNLVREVAKVAGGGGGGGPQFATAGGRDVSKVEAATERAKAFLGETVK